jgi:hypothetical protein
MGQVVALISWALLQGSTHHRHTCGCRVAIPIPTRSPAAAKQCPGAARSARITINTLPLAGP